MPGREYVETYIKAYYLPDDTLEAWVKEHKVDIKNQSRTTAYNTGYKMHNP